MTAMASDREEGEQAEESPIAWLDRTIGRFTRCTGADWCVRVWCVKRLDGPPTSDPDRYDPYGVFVCDSEDGTFNVTIRRDGEDDYDDETIAEDLTAEAAVTAARAYASKCDAAGRLPVAPTVT